jgi:hypothetical protein
MGAYVDRQIKSILAIVSVLFVAVPLMANAQIVNVTCHSYFSAESAPDGIAAFFNVLEQKTAAANISRPPLGLRQCLIEGRPPYYTLLFPTQARFGTCYFTEQDATSAFASNGTFMGDKPAPSTIPNAQKMLVTNESCPRQDSDLYTSTSGVPPGVFRSIVAFWAKATSSDAELSSAYSLSLKDDLSKRARDQFQTAMSKRFGNPPMISRVVASMDFTAPLAYEIWVGRDGGWVFDIDLSSDGWKIVRVGSWVA